MGERAIELVGRGLAASRSGLSGVGGLCGPAGLAKSDLSGIHLVHLVYLVHSVHLRVPDPRPHQFYPGFALWLLAIRAALHFVSPRITDPITAPAPASSTRSTVLGKYG